VFKRNDQLLAPRLIIFDLGRVLIRICSTMQEASLRAGNTFVPTDLSPFAKAELGQLSQRGDLGQFDELQLITRLAPILQMPPGQARLMFEQFLIGPYPGVIELLTDLRSAGHPTACLSNTNAAHWRLMTTPGTHAHLPLDLLTHRFASHLLRLRKPDPAIYREVEKRTATPASQITFFDDLQENVDAAARCGWNAILVPHLDNPIPFLREQLFLATPP
jgi:putative hydrolase of the HAD superfamily